MYLSIYLLINITHWEPSQELVAGGVTALAMLGKGEWEQSRRRFRKFWGRGLGVNIYNCRVACAIISDNYDRGKDKFMYISVQQSISLILSLLSNLET
jgi:hypothetical protein